MSRIVRLALGLAGLLVIVCDASQVSAQDAVRDGRKALRDSGRYPWYDRESDSLKQVNLPNDTKAASDNRDSSWVAKDSTTTRNRTNNFNPPTFSGLNTLVTVLFWIMVVLFFLVLATALVWALLRQRTKESDESLDQLLEDDRTDEERIEQLPFEVKAPKSDLLGEARRCFEAGDRRRAIILLFSYMLVKLDREQWIRLAKGKTNRQYLRELGDHRRLGSVVERTMVAFEDVFFGHHELSADEFDACWREVDQFHQLVEAQRS